MHPARGWIHTQEMFRCGFGGYQVHWQYRGPYGWKNFEPVPNDEVVQAHSQLALTGAPRVAEVTHVWNHWKKGVQRERWKVDFMKMKQRKVQGPRTERPVRLVAFNIADIRNPPWITHPCRRIPFVEPKPLRSQ